MAAGRGGPGEGPLAAGEPQARSALGYWDELLAGDRIQQVRWEDLMAPAIAISLQVRHPMYDCLYVAASRQLDAELITADGTLHKRMGPPFSKLALLKALSAPDDVSFPH